MEEATKNVDMYEGVLSTFKDLGARPRSIASVKRKILKYKTYEFILRDKYCYQQRIDHLSNCNTVDNNGIELNSTGY